MLNGMLQKLQTGLVAAVLGSSAIADGVEPSVPTAWHEGRMIILRFQKDVSRERGWMLTPSGVMVFDYRTRETTAFVALPEWVWAGEAYICPPDLALGPKGEALVSSNVVPSLWRIDPVSLRVTRHDLVVDAHGDKDVGFTGLMYAPELGAYFGISHFGALWRIDPQLRRAQHVTLNQPIQRACGLTAIPRMAERRSVSR